MFNKIFIFLLFVNPLVAMDSTSEKRSFFPFFVRTIQPLFGTVLGIGCAYKLYQAMPTKLPLIWAGAATYLSVLGFISAFSFAKENKKLREEKSFVHYKVPTSSQQNTDSADQVLLKQYQEISQAHSDLKKKIAEETEKTNAKLRQVSDDYAKLENEYAKLFGCNKELLEVGKKNTELQKKVTMLDEHLADTAQQLAIFQQKYQGLEQELNNSKEREKQWQQKWQQLKKAREITASKWPSKERVIASPDEVPLVNLGTQRTGTNPSAASVAAASIGAPLPRSRDSSPSNSWIVLPHLVSALPLINSF